MLLPDDWRQLYFTPFPDVVYVKGKHDAAAYDFNRGSLIPVPPVLLDLVEQLKRWSCGEVAAALPSEEQELIVPYLEYLLRRDFGTMRPERVAFHPLNEDWSHAGNLLSAQLELSRHSHYDWQNVLAQITDLNCFQLELRLFDNWGEEAAVNKLLEPLRGTTLRAINVYVSQAAVWTSQALRSMFESHPKLLHFKGYGVTQPLSLSFQPGSAELTPAPLTDEILQANHYRGRYVVNYQFYTESRKHHPLLHRRVAVNDFGYWKNDLNYPATFGHVGERELREVLTDEGFTRLWHVNPDKILELKDSARRYAVWTTDPLEPAPESPGYYRYTSSTTQKGQ